MAQQFDGRVAVVTGGASGIGAATVAALQAKGAHVACLDRTRVNAADLSLEVDITDASGAPWMGPTHS